MFQKYIINGSLKFSIKLFRTKYPTPSNKHLIFRNIQFPNSTTSNPEGFPSKNTERPTPGIKLSLYYAETAKDVSLRTPSRARIIQIYTKQTRAFLIWLLRSINGENVEKHREDSRHVYKKCLRSFKFKFTTARGQCQPSCLTNSEPIRITLNFKTKRELKSTDLISYELKLSERNSPWIWTRRMLTRFAYDAVKGFGCLRMLIFRGYFFHNRNRLI